MRLRAALALLPLCCGCPTGRELPKDAGIGTISPDRPGLADGPAIDQPTRPDAVDRGVQPDLPTGRDLRPPEGVRGPDLVGKPDQGPVPDRAPDTQPLPAASVVVSKGASAQGLPGCSSVYCRYIVATTASFTSQVTCSGEWQTGGGFGSWTQAANQTKQTSHYFGWPNQWVTVTCIDGQKHSATGKITW